MLARRVAIASLALTLSLGAVACGSDGSDGATSSGDDEVTTTVADGGTDEGTTDDTAADEGSDEGEATNPGTETLVEEQAGPENTVTLQADGTWSPSELEVEAGEVFTFIAADGAPTAAVTFNGSDSYTITTGLFESFTLDTPGTYTVSEFISGTTMTVTVTG